MSPRTVVAMSGGVDSSVTAALLQEQGHEVVGLFLRHGQTVEAPAGSARRQGCCSAADAADARAVAATLGIPFYAIDFSDVFGTIVERFVDEYARGRTPNPCVACNRDLKFGALLGFARELGAERVATGHYARLERDPGGALRLRRGADRAKDQSYVLFPLSREQLAAALFPVGGLPKSEVRALARRFALPVSEKPESMEICFVPGGDYRALVRARRPDAVRAGAFVDREGRRLGDHGGVPLFTIGQRRGLGVALGEPAYVVELRPGSGEVVLGRREELEKREFQVERVHWLSREAPGPGEEVACAVQIRSRSPALPGRVRVVAGGRAIVLSDEPQSAVTPGQAAVFYDGDVVLGGGWIAPDE
jgi:tRNA-specific 2-thiouridylase